MLSVILNLQCNFFPQSTFSYQPVVRMLYKVYLSILCHIWTVNISTCSVIVGVVICSLMCTRFHLWCSPFQLAIYKPIFYITDYWESILTATALASWLKCSNSTCVSLLLGMLLPPLFGYIDYNKYSYEYSNIRVIHTKLKPQEFLSRALVKTHISLEKLCH